MNYRTVLPASHYVRGAAPRRQQQRPYEQVAMLPPGYSLIPMGQTAPLAPAPKQSKWMLILLAVVVIAALIWLAKNKDKGPKTIKKVSTARLAQNLYKRLEARPRRNPSTMAALAQHGRE